MTSPDQDASPLAGASYAALRYEGVPPLRARVDLGLSARAAARLERLFLARPGCGADAMRPRFARHDLHVRAAAEAGGFPVMTCRAR